VKTYADVGSVIREGITQYVKEVKDRSFPAEEHVFKAENHEASETTTTLYGSKKEKVGTTS